MQFLNEMAPLALAAVPELVSYGLVLPNRKVYYHQCVTGIGKDPEAPWRLIRESCQVLKLHRYFPARLEFRLAGLTICGADYDHCTLGAIIRSDIKSPTDSVWKFIESLAQRVEQESRQ